jgi:large subunit ribosomal protein L29
MSVEKIRGTDTADLKKQLSDSEEQMFRLRFQLSMGQQEGVKKLRELKKDRARTLTVLREREINAAKEGK